MKSRIHCRMMEGNSFLLFMIFLFLVGYQVAVAQRSSYIVHMDKSVMPKPYLSHNEWYSSTLASIKTEPSSPNTHIYTYDNALHGFCAMLSEQELEALKKSPGFLTAYKDLPAIMHTTHTPQFLSLNPDTGLWPASNFGENVIVGVIDSGVWPESPSFKDSGMTPNIPAKWKGTCEAGERFNSSVCNLKLIGARNFNKGFIAANPNTSVDINSARDTFGHGTHTSSTVGGNLVEGASFFGYAKGTARGIAPKARLAMYKVGSLQGLASSDVVAGMDQAIADGVDIISISIGISGPIHKDPIAIASFGAMEKGILVSCSAGNGGPELGTALNGFPWAMTVGASSMDRSFGGLLTLGNGLTIAGWSLYPEAKNLTDLPLIYSKAISPCTSSHHLSTAGHGIVICENPVLFYEGDIVANSTVSAAIFFSDDAGMFRDSRFNFPGVAISPKFQNLVMNYAANTSKPTATIRFQQTLLGTKPAPAVADFSSKGPDRHVPTILKPDLIAPGTLVLAACVPNIPVATIGDKHFFTGFRLASGTSMSCPHASGVAALLKGAHPDWSPSVIRSAMMTTAETLDNTGAPIKDIGFNFTAASPLAMGAGQVNPNRALNPGLVYNATAQDYINHLCSMNLTHAQISSITRSTKTDCSNPSSDLNYPSFIALYNGKETATALSRTFRRTVTNVGDGAATYEAQVIVPKGSTIEVSPGELKFRGKGEMQTYSMTIHYRGGGKISTVSYGSLTWVEVGGAHKVKSPIVVSPLFKIG